MAAKSHRMETTPFMVTRVKSVKIKDWKREK